MKESLLITGVSSRLMKTFIDIIEFEKYNIFAITRNKKSIENKNIQVLEGDICNRAFVNDAVKDMDTIIHAAAVTHAFCENEYNRVNVQGTQNLVEAARENKVKRFVFVSSRTAGMDSGAYGISKYKGEQYIQNNLANWLIFRPGEIFGGDKNEGVEKLINDVLTKKILLCPAQVKNKLFPVFIGDVAKIMYDLALEERRANEIFIINGKEGYSFIGLAECICRVSSKKRIIIPVPKAFMQVIGWIIKRIHIQIGLVPDQITRLYCHKEVQHLNYNLMSIREYVLKHNK